MSENKEMITKLQCQCGAVQARVDLKDVYSRAICYCADCQAFARFLGHQQGILNPHGGTDILAMLPAAIHFTAGLEHLSCMSLSETGILRWYTSCCRTPIGNTPRAAKMAYVGLITQCLPSLETAIAPARVVLNTASAIGEVKSTPVAVGFAVLKIMRGVLGARLTGKYKSNPFFEPASKKPLCSPALLSSAERDALYLAK